MINRIDGIDTSFLLTALIVRALALLLLFDFRRLQIFKNETDGLDISSHDREVEWLYFLVVVIDLTQILVACLRILLHKQL